MTCDRCDESRAGGSKFCPFCGADLSDDCPMCQSQRDEGSNFCTFCGKRFHEAEPVPEPPTEEQDHMALLRKITAIMMPAVAILLIIEAGCMLWGIGDVWDWCATGSMEILALVPVLIGVADMTGLTLQIAWILIVLAILASLILLTKQSLPSLLDKSKETADRITSTPLYMVALMFGASLALDIIVMAIGAAFNTYIETPDGLQKLENTPEGLLRFANAAVWEEVISRVAYIGLPIMIAALILRRRDAPKMLLGGFGMSKLAIVLIVISALVFGFAHSSGWGFFKVLPTFLSGFLFGYLYVKIGVHASIAMHFVTDYMSVAAATSLTAIVGLMMVIVFCVGFVCLIQILLGMRGAKEKVAAMPNWVPEPQDNMLFKQKND